MRRLGRGLALAVLLDHQRQAEGARQVLRGEGLGDGAGGDQAAVAQQRDMGVARRDLLDVVGDHDYRGCVGIGSELGEPREQVLAAHAGAQEALRDTRSLVQGYRSTTLVDELENASSVLGAAGIHTDVDLPPMLRTWAGRSRPFPDSTGDGPADALTSNVLGLVVREATTNILRHASAGSASYEVFREATGAHDGTTWRLEIVNDGADAAPSASPGTGLQGLRERVESLNGTLTAQHRDGRFILEILLPQPQPERTTT